MSVQVLSEESMARIQGLTACLPDLTGPELKALAEAVKEEYSARLREEAAKRNAEEIARLQERIDMLSKGIRPRGRPNRPKTT